MIVLVKQLFYTRLVEYEMVIADHLLSNGMRACGIIVKYTNLLVFNHVIRQEDDRVPRGYPRDCFVW